MVRTAVLALACLLPGAAAQTPPRTAELITLLRAGVPAGEVATLVRRRGLPARVTEHELVALGRAGAGEELLGLLSRALRSRRELQRLAATRTAVAIHGSGLKALVPRGWTSSRTRLGEGAVLVTFREELDGDGDWLTEPALLVFVHRGSPFVATAAPRLAEVLARHVAGHLSSSGTPARLAGSRAGRVGAALVPEVTVAVQDRRRQLEGRLTLRLRILDDGTVVAAGYACGGGESARMQPLFRDLASSLEAPEDVGARNDGPPAAVRRR